MNNTYIIIISLIIITGGYFYFTKEESNKTTLDETTLISETDNINLPEMTFFITSENPGTGANFGGLDGADAYCQTLADSTGTRGQTWRAYLSAVATDGSEATNARDRIGDGPWHNYNGELIANSVEDLHSDTNPINKETGLTENGDQINGRGDSPNVHDILTGSNADGTLALSDSDTTCENWTSGTDTGSAIVGHHDRLGPDTLETATSWNAAHASRGCSLPNLNSTGGGGLLYCFAI